MDRNEELDKLLTPEERRVLDTVLGSEADPLGNPQPYRYFIPVPHCPICGEDHGHVAFYILPDEVPTIMWALCPRKVDALIATIDIATLPGKGKPT